MFLLAAFEKYFDELSILNLKSETYCFEIDVIFLLMLNNVTVTYNFSNDYSIYISQHVSLYLPKSKKSCPNMLDQQYFQKEVKSLSQQSGTVLNVLSQ